jgi:hypothetical protein
MAARKVYTEADKERFAAERRDKLDAMHEQLATAITRMQDGAEWTSWLGFASGFHRYSFNNTVLMWVQAEAAGRPTPTMVAGYRAWQAKGYRPLAGQGMRIFAPVFARVPLRDKAGNEVHDTNGDTVLVRRVVGAKPVTVWDVASVDGPPLPSFPTPQLLVGQAPAGLWMSLSEIAIEDGFDVTRGDCGGANGWTNFNTREIRVRDDVDDAQAVKTLVHELAHMRLHGTAGVEAGQVLHRGVEEVEAESVAFIVLDAHGIDTSQYTFNYVLGWATAATKAGVTVEDLITTTGDRVISTADAILQHTRPDDPAPLDAVDALATSLDIPAASTPAASWEAVTARTPAAPITTGAPTPALSMAP